jgi:conjugal transfer pilus assembly protein TraF
MIKCFFGVTLILFSWTVYAEKPTGFLWYNLPKEEKPKHQKGTPFHALSYTDKDAVLKFYTMEALHKVRFTHRVQDERTFLALQNFWLKEATLHGLVNQKALLEYPEYDFSVTHPTSELGSKLYDSLRSSKAQDTIKHLAKHQGLLFFYRAENQIDLQQIPILKDFCNKYHFTLMSVSVDGVKAPDLPESRIDSGQAQSLGIHYFPAILLVNPKTKHTAPVAYGLTTQDVLSEHLNAVAHQF